LAQPHNPSRKGGKAGGPLDRELALARVDGDTEMLASLVEVLLSELPLMVQAVQEAMGAGNAAQLERAAHRLKGSVSIFGALEATEAALELENIGRRGDLQQAAGVWAALEKQIEGLRPALQELRRELGHS